MTGRAAARNRSQATVCRDGAPAGSPLGLNAKHSLLGIPSSIAAALNPLQSSGSGGIRSCSMGRAAVWIYRNRQHHRVGGIANALGCVEEIANTIAVCRLRPHRRRFLTPEPIESVSRGRTRRYGVSAAPPYLRQGTLVRATVGVASLRSTCCYRFNARDRDGPLVHCA
jgi:hypothetical protein